MNLISDQWVLWENKMDTDTLVFSWPSLGVWENLGFSVGSIHMSSRRNIAANAIGCLLGIFAADTDPNSGHFWQENK